MLPEIVRRALVETVVNIGQLSVVERRTLDSYAKKGYLSKGKGGPFPVIKTVWAHPGFDFAADRERHYQEFCVYAEMDRVAREQRRAAGMSY